MRVERMNGARGGKRLLRMLGVLLALTVLAPSGASAHSRTWNGNLAVLASTFDKNHTADYLAFQASSCADTTDGVSWAFFDATALRNHRVTVTINGSTQGTSQDRVVNVFVGFAGCQSVEAFAPGFFRQVGSARWARPFTFTVPPTAFSIGLMNGGNAVQLRYTMTAGH